jgi:hypothetical protein
MHDLRTIANEPLWISGDWKSLCLSQEIASALTNVFPHENVFLDSGQPACETNHLQRAKV